MARWWNRIFFAKLDGRSVCFKINEANDGITKHSAGHLFKDNWKAILPSQEGPDSTRFKWASGYHSLEQKLGQADKWTLHCFCSTTDYYNRGFLLKNSNKDCNPEHQYDPEDFDTFEISHPDCVIWNGQVIGKVEPTENPDVHPAFQNRLNNSLFHCLIDAVDIHLKDERVEGNKVVSELLEIVNSSALQRKVFTPPANPRSGDGLNYETKRKSWIVIEGLDGTGKSTLVNRLASRLEAKKYCTPPPQIGHLRDSFDTKDMHSLLIRKLFYAVGNYLPASSVKETLKHNPVIMDRYWHSTAAYAIATECEAGDEASLPPEGHWVYEWPVDLQAPDLVVFLTVPEEVRAQRIEARNSLKTDDEKLIARSLQFRQRILGAYQRIVGPPVVEVDASGNEEEVENAVVSVIQGRKQLNI